MAIQIIEENKKPSFMDRLGAGIESGGQEAGRAIPGYYQGKHQQEQERLRTQKLAQLTGMDLSGLSPEMQQEAFKQTMQAKNLPNKFKSQYEAKYKAELEMMKELGLNLNEPEESQKSPVHQKEVVTPSGKKPRGILNEEFEEKKPEKIKKEQVLIPQSKIDAMSIVKPALADKWARRNEAVLKQQMHDENFSQKEREMAEKAQRAIDKVSRQKFESDRDFNTKFALPVIQQVDQESRQLPIQEAALSNMLNAIERGDDVGFLSPDWWADFTGIQAFRSMTGAQLENAAKEFLLSNIGQAGTRPNMWIEQRMLSMAPSVGKTPEANATFAEGLKEALDLKRFYINKVNDLKQQDFQEHGYAKADIATRASRALDEYAKERQEITKYRMQDLYERDHNIKSANDLRVVEPGTPLTRRVKDILKKEYGANALEAAKRLGYSITPKGFAEKAEAR